MFVHDEGQIVFQFEDTGTNTVDEADLTHRYLWGPAVDQVLADEQVDWSDSDADGEVLWALTDHLGTVRDIIDNDASYHNHRNFDAFGNLVSESATTKDFLFAYTGKAFDEATGLQYNWNRWYDPKTGRWISEGPIGFSAGDANKVRYVANNPSRYFDPNGLHYVEAPYYGDDGRHDLPPLFLSDVVDIPMPPPRPGGDSPIGPLHDGLTIGPYDPKYDDTYRSPAWRDMKADWARYNYLAGKHRAFELPNKLKDEYSKLCDQFDFDEDEVRGMPPEEFLRRKREGNAIIDMLDEENYKQRQDLLQALVRVRRSTMNNRPARNLMQSIDECANPSRGHREWLEEKLWRQRIRIRNQPPGGNGRPGGRPPVRR